MLPVCVLKVILRLGLAAQLREVNLITDYLPEIENESALAKRGCKVARQYHWVLACAWALAWAHGLSLCALALGAEPGLLALVLVLPR